MRNTIVVPNYRFLLSFPDGWGNVCSDSHFLNHNLVSTGLFCLI